ncbi:MFS general substrate transporter [Xylona heveae TC161]|uniref:MFS general substrate transporter n=1 Tax=Xylona heveae (strain CBS 132557 / TC161) TaxID=1328760 RepID=A0A165JWV9_XYLHT|nr:MFS general substrate transporter [Xylona heveae TC161]KZF26725.1 MFS general substrate transporter [Xylona heveae TC161]
MSTTDEHQLPTIELQSRDQHSNEHGDLHEAASQGQELKPVDRGRDAWIVLIATFVIEALFWGFPMCFGIFQNYYSDLPEFKNDRANIPIIGTLAQGLYSVGAPFSAALTKRFPKHQRQQIWAGWPLCIIGLLAASFVNSVNGLIVTQGVLYGIGFVTLSYPTISMVNEWWVARKGMAFGLISAASGATGAAMPFILESLLAKYGHRITLRASAVAMFILTAPLLPLFRGRLPPSETATLARIDWAFFKRPLFWVYACSIFVQGLGFYFPVVFLPSYATSVGMPTIKGALLSALMSIAQVLGQFFFGFLSDKNLSVSFLAIACCIVAAAASFGLWGPAKSMPLLVVFSLIYGFFGFAFGTMRVAMGLAVTKDPSNVFATFPIFVFLQGIGNILVGPISAALVSGKASPGRFGAGLYESTIIFTGSSSILAALIIGLWHGYQPLKALLKP